MTLDLLEQRRLQLGIAGDRPLAIRPLLMRSGAIGGGLIACVLVVGVVLSLRQAQLRQVVSELQPQAAASERLRLEGEAQNRLARRLKQANSKLAEALVAVPSSSAWLSALAQIVPSGLQLTSAVVSGRELSLEGVASDPNGFIRINALQLGLQRSPLFLADAVALQDARRLNPGQAEPSGSIRFRLKARFGKQVPLLDEQQLQALGAAGMAHRLRVVQKLRVLP
jgi:type IV pilus assembly protein PilN